MVYKLGKLVWWKIGGFCAVVVHVVPLRSVSVSKDLSHPSFMIESPPEDVCTYTLYIVRTGYSASVFFTKGSLLSHRIPY